ncbi:MAG: oxygen-independent coproporphyrinogen III oxidase [Kangiellaceae bacterium]|jgi:oxygen-independent coproporphyrinogen-3 oxidase|nr:oxygen-independent coproporphyrinogen III oxidase [Kangiellaceae bacterium]
MPSQPDTSLSSYGADTRIQWDDQLIERYNVSGPRYTSYPTALEFTEQVTSTDYIESLQSIERDKPISVYVHIPFCWHVCYYCACNKVVTRDYTKVNPYINALEQEIALVANNLNQQKVTQLHWGGGTPTYLNKQDRKRLVDLLNRYFNLASGNDIEASIEVDPRTVSCDEISELRQLGFNRISLGIQDFNIKVQTAVNRIQSFEDTQALVVKSRQEQFRSISFDLIYGLPHQTVESFSETLDQVIELRPDRLSVFNYAHLPHRFGPQRRINADQLPTSEEKLAILHLTIDKMTQAGYVYVGMDHFALPDDELALAQQRGELHRNFQGYTTQKECDLIGLGVSSIGSINGHYFQNQKEINAYYNELADNSLATWRGVKVTDDDIIRKNVIFQIICNFNLEFSEVEQAFKIEFWAYFNDVKPTIEAMASDGLIELTEHGLSVTAKGRLFVRNVCMAFDGNLLAMAAMPGYSKAI